MAIWNDFKRFALKGNIVDLAVAVVIGVAFGKIVSALVSDLVMPLVALVMPSGDWRAAAIVLRHAADPKDDVVLRYGDLLGAILDFLVVAFALFLVIAKGVKAAERRRSKGEEPTTKECPHCLEMIPLKATRCRACTAELGPPTPISTVARKAA